MKANVSRKQWIRYWSSRWPIAGLLNRSPRTCWVHIVNWALDGGRDQLREIGGGENCRQESAVHRDKSCYCSKFTNGCLTRKNETRGES